MKKSTLFFLVFLIPFCSFAQLKLASVFGDHMILQRNKPIVIWGFNTPNSIVKIRFDSENREIITNSLGRWEVIFPAKEVGAPLAMQVWDEDEKLEVKDILMGEVWLCSGQSNMEWKLERSLNGAEEIKLGDITPTRDLLFVKDTINGFLKIAQCDELIGHEVNIATQSEISVGDLAQHLIDSINPNAKIITDSLRLRPEKSEVFRLFGSNEKLKSFTGWSQNFTLADGLKETIDWFSKKENLQQYKSDIYNV